MLAILASTADMATGAALQMYLTGQSHPSGLYHVGNRTTLNIRVVNSDSVAQTLAGNLHWVLRTGNGEKAILLATTPIRPTVLADGQMVRITVPETLPRIGLYQLLWHGAVVPDDARFQPPRCIYTPAAGLPGAVNPWMAPLPPSFLQPHPVGLIASYVRETGIRHYLLNITRVDDSIADFRTFNHTLALHLQHAGADLIEVFTIPDHGWQRNREIHSGTIWSCLSPLQCVNKAVVVRYSGVPTASTASEAVALITSIHKALRIMKSSAILFATPDVIRAGKGAVAFSAMIGGVALTDTRESMRLSHELQRSGVALPVMILPATSAASVMNSTSNVPDPTLFLAAAARYVPVAAGKNNFTVHVLGAGKLLTSVHPHLPLLAAVFQQAYGACAVISGLGGGGVKDQIWNAWQMQPPLMVKENIWRTAVAQGIIGWKRLLAAMPHPGQFPHGKIIVIDAEGLMRTRGNTGLAMPTPYPGWQEIPLNQQVYFLTYPGSPANLAAAIRTAEIKGLPPACVTAAVSKLEHKGQPVITLLIRNARVGRLRGTILLAVSPVITHPTTGWKISRTVPFGPIHSGNCVTVRLPLKNATRVSAGEQIVAILHWHQRVEITPLFTIVRALETAGQDIPADNETVSAAQIKSKLFPPAPPMTAAGARIPKNKVVSKPEPSSKSTEKPYMPAW
ncbi:MAG: hypothetical protein ACP5VQ_02615 [Phycisphaerae bacterium]